MLQLRHTASRTQVPGGFSMRVRQTNWPGHSRDPRFMVLIAARSGTDGHSTVLGVWQLPHSQGGPLALLKLRPVFYHLELELNGQGDHSVTSKLQVGGHPHSGSPLWCTATAGALRLTTRGHVTRN